jgi:hypothetical protein
MRSPAPNDLEFSKAIAVDSFHPRPREKVFDNREIKPSTIINCQLSIINYS